MTRDDEGTFYEYRLLILDSLREIKDRLTAIEKKLSIVEVELRETRIKAGLWGALAGAVPTALAAFLLWLRTT